MFPYTSGLGIIPLFSENAKFDGTNWLIWKEAIMMVIDSKGAKDYLDGSIFCPVPASKIPTITVMKAPGATSTTASPTLLPTIITISETYWDLLTPSIREWKTYNAWTKMLLLFNTTEPTGLGIDTSGMSYSGNMIIM